MQIHAGFSPKVSHQRHNKAALCELSQFVCHSRVKPFSFISVLYSAVGGWGFQVGRGHRAAAEPDSRDGYHLTEATKNKGWCSQHGGLKIPFYFDMKSYRERFTADVIQKMSFL